MCPSGTVSVVDRHKRLTAIKDLADDGKTDAEIAEELGISLTTVKRNKKYLKELSLSDLTPDKVAEKRAEIEIELIEAIGAAKEQFENHKDSYKVARSWFLSWMDAVKLKMQLYGLDSVKFESFTQINTLNQYVEPDTIDVTTGDRIAKLIKKTHENKLDEY